MARIVSAAILGLLLPGCATVVTGTTQPVMVETEPEGANCTVRQNGFPVGAVASTPGVVAVSKGSASLNVTCSKAGYQTAQQTVPFGLQGWLFGNAVLGGLIGVIVDFSSGAAFQYAPGTQLALLADSHVRPYLFSETGQRFALSEGSGGRNPLVVPPATPTGDVTYRWSASSPN